MAKGNSSSKKTETKKTGAKKADSRKTTKKTSQSTTQKSSSAIDAAMEKKRAKAGVVDNIWGVVFVAVGVFLVAATQFDAAGQLGHMMGDFLKGTFGLVGIILPVYLFIIGFLLFFNKTVHISGGSFGLMFLVLLMFCLINSGRFIPEHNQIYNLVEFYKDGIDLIGGGLFGMGLGVPIVKFFGHVGLYIISIVVIAVSLLLVINTPVSHAIANHKEKKVRKMLEREEEAAKADAIRAEAEMRAKEVAEKKEEQAKFNPQFFAAADIPSAEKPVRDFPPVNSRRDTMPLDELSKNRKSDKVFDLYKDEGLFTKEEEKKKKTEKVSKGLDAVTPPSGGKGLDGKGLDGKEPEAKVFDPVITSASEPVIKTFGLEDSSFSGPGYGLEESGVDNKSSKGLGLDGKLPEMAEDAAIGAAAAGITKAADKKSEEPKLTNKEAEALSLKDEDFNKVKKKARYKLPPLNLLNNPVNTGNNNVSRELKEKAEILEETLKSFNVDASVVQVTQGPAVTRYEIQPAVGVKVSSIVRLSDDIALNLRAKSIRIEAPIPGKAAVGIEVENEKINTVTIKEIIGSKEFKDAKSKITFAVGRDIAGKSIVADLKSMPHLLIAGSTGSGKSVCINSIITSILYKADPDEVKLVLIDPKVVELGNYNGIPHLLVPVVTEPSKAAATLNWAVSEMTKRYKVFAETHTRDLAGYNQHMRENGEEEKVMPQVVIIIDELADLMMAAPSQVEESICRLAQMARAAGMHLIVATQRPSVDIITGVIKANIPSRIAFAVSSQFDSRTILDMSGAEKLVGKGDMLFNPLGMGKPIRVQGCFISDDEVHNVIEYVKGQVQDVEYSEDVMDTIERGNAGPGAQDDDADELLHDAIEFVVKQGQASVSMIQRRFRVGYNRGARIMDQMEERGIVGPQDGSRPRQVLMSEEELEALKNPKEGNEE